MDSLFAFLEISNALINLFVIIGIIAPLCIIAYLYKISTQLKESEKREEERHNEIKNALMKIYLNLKNTPK